MVQRPKKTHVLAITESPEQTGLSAWVQLARVYDGIHNKVVSSLIKEGLTVPQFDVLATIRYSEGMTQQEVSRRLLVTKGNVCGVLHRLEALGLVERRMDPEDGRANRLYLTATGHKKIASVFPVHDERVLSVMQALSITEVSSLKSLLTKLESAAVAT